MVSNFRPFAVPTGQGRAYHELFISSSRSSGSPTIPTSLRTGWGSQVSQEAMAGASDNP